MEKVLSVKNLTKKYHLGQISAKDFFRKKGEEFTALDNVSFDIFKGERVGIIGANGAGKSTLLKLISRITSPSDGCISVKGKISGMLEIGAGFNGELTGRENIYLNGAILGMSKSEIDSKINEIIDFSECEEFIDTPVKRYSSGMFVRLAFSVAAHLESNIILMDEVLAVGDSEFQKKCIDKMYSLAKNKGKTILFVSHNMQTIKELCNRCIVLKKGKVVFDGETQKAISLYLDNNFNMQKENREFERNEDVMTSQLRILSVSLKENKLPFPAPLELTLKFEGMEEINSFHFAFTLTNEENIKVGSFVTEPLTLKKGIITKDFSFETKNLPKGKYSVSISAVEPLSSKMLNRLDEVFSAFSFETEGEEKINGLTTDWQKDLWGNVIL